MCFLVAWQMLTDVAVYNYIGNIKTLRCIIHINNIQKECMQHCKNKIVKITNLLVSTVARNSVNCNLICCVGCYGYTRNYNPIIVISIILILSIRYT